MPVLRTMLIITALVLGWIAMRTETFASVTPKPSSVSLVQGAVAQPTPAR